jgi:hypothetical protein
MEGPWLLFVEARDDCGKSGFRLCGLRLAREG